MCVRARRTRAVGNAVRHREHGCLPGERGTSHRMELPMKACPTCGIEVRPLWPTCRSCGTLLMAAPAPLVEIGAQSDPGPSVDEQFFVPAVYQAPVTVDPPIPVYTHSPRIAGSGSGAGKWIALVGMVVFVLGAVATAWFTIRPSAAAKHETPVALAPRTPTAG